MEEFITILHSREVFFFGISNAFFNPFELSWHSFPASNYHFDVMTVMMESFCKKKRPDGHFFLALCVCGPCLLDMYPVVRYLPATPLTSQIKSGRDFFFFFWISKCVMGFFRFRRILDKYMSRAGMGRRIVVVLARVMWSRIWFFLFQQEYRQKSLRTRIRSPQNPPTINEMWMCMESHDF